MNFNSVRTKNSKMFRFLVKFQPQPPITVARRLLPKLEAHDTNDHHQHRSVTTPLIPTTSSFSLGAYSIPNLSDYHSSFYLDRCNAEPL